MRSRLLLAAALLACAACSQPTAPRTTIQQYMEGEVNPAGEFLFHSVQEISDEKGKRLKAPSTAAQWKEVRDQLTVLQNAPDVLTAKGVKAAPAGFKAENPGIESEPAWIEQAIAANRSDFDKRAHRLREAADVAVQAVEARDPMALQRALDRVDKACEGCHLHYFYPNDKRAWQAAKDDGIVD
jgi:cytochrome c556